VFEAIPTKLARFKVDVEGPETFPRRDSIACIRARSDLLSGRRSKRFTRSDKRLALSDLLVHLQFTTKPVLVH
jgi:hypothetical protein